ncbi:MAG TPA: hypothetical protein VNN73_00245 [Blastocatellia bacterium]|nr:hypothetical protein [Blastocatellia bacterium]
MNPFNELSKYVSETDLNAIRNITDEIKERIERFQHGRNMPGM